MKKRGFTLLEILLAMMIIVMLMASISEILYQGFKAKESAEDAMATVRDVNTVGDIMAEELSCVMPPSPLTADPNSVEYQAAETAATQADPNASIVVAQGGINGMQASSAGSYLAGPFQGDAQSVQFYTTGVPPRTPVPSGIIFVRYELTSDNDGTNKLIRTSNTNILNSGVEVSQLPQETLIKGVQRLEFQYYDGTNWTSSWDTTGADNGNQLPYAVKIILTLNPIHPGGAVRTLTRVATIWTAQKTVNDYNNAVNAAANIAATQTGVGG